MVEVGPSFSSHLSKRLLVAYESFSAERFFAEITTEEAAARTLLWRSRFQGKEFHCPRCHAEQWYALATRPEVRTCKGCRQ